MRQWLRKYARFFLIVTSVFGASTGVGIWVAIGLVQPQATQHLIRGFVMGWATEWVVFMAEMACITVYYYGWDRLSPEKHLKVGYLYALCSWLTLVVINGILTFMLTSSNWPQTHWMWSGFFNATYWPSLFVRTVIAWALAGVYVFWTGSVIADAELKERVLKFASGWMFPAYVLMPFLALWFFVAIPPLSRDVLHVGVSGTAVGNFSVLTRVVLVTVVATATLGFVVYFGPYRNAKAFSRGMAAGVALLAFTVTGTTEWAREMLRKPFVIREVMYSNGVRVEQVAGYQKDGFLPSSVWPMEFIRQHGDTPLVRGQALFRAQCMACHTTDGYRSMKRLVGNRDLEALRSFTKMLRSQDMKENAYLKFMPPLATSETEAQELALYLNSLNHAQDTNPKTTLP
jgi:mono/diheme cytochrome c family protein